MAKKTTTKTTEKHVTLLTADHDKLRKLATLQKRSMRNTVTILVDEALKKLAKKGL